MEVRRMPVRKLRGRRLFVVAIALLAASCSGGSGGGYFGDDGGDAGAGAGGGGNAGAISITEPASGAQVQLPFTLKFKSEVELGPTEKGVHHVHVFFDGDDSKYEVVEADSFEVKSLPAGKHTVHASLRNADHSPAGSETQIDVEVTGDGGTAPAETTPPGDYDY
jgi:hypothetical protein